MARPGYYRSNTWSYESRAPSLFRETGQSAARMAFHLSIEHWLGGLELEEYFPLFQHYQSVENLLHLSERHISELGVTNSAHRARLASNLVYIREKLKRSSIAGGPLSSLTSPRQRSSIAGSPYSSPVPSPSPSSKASFRYSTIPEGVTPELPPSPKTFKMDYQDTSPEDLRKELESELKLPNEDIRSHAWFHGGISRDKVEKLLISNGDFLVRDSISQPGNYVLSVCCRSSPMHFVINRVVMQADTPYASIQYQFERECFDSIPSLIRFYIGNARPISQTSAAVIQRPVNRSVPLSFIDSKYAAINRSQASACTYGVLPRRVVTPRLALGQDNFRQRSGSQPAIMRNSVVVDPTILERSESSPTINRPVNGFAMQPLNDKSEHRPLARTGSEPIIESPNKDYAYPAPNTSSVGDLTAPPLPPFRTNKSGESIPNGNPASLTETINVVNRSFDPPSMFVTDHLYSEIDQYDPLPIRFSVLHDKSDPKPPPPEENGNEVDLKEKKRHSDTRNSVLDTDYSKVAELDKDVEKKPEKLVIPLPLMEEPSCIHLSDFTTSLMSSENKPLEGTILAEVKQRLLDTDPVVLAKHITTIDFEMCRITDTSSKQPGLEVMTLPQGAQIRQDLLERYSCLKTWCAVCVLTCTGPEQRIRMLNQWIQVAEALRGSLGNLFSFTAVMDGLGCKQLMQLKKSWELLRSMHTSSAVNYETKLRSLLKSLNSGENALPLTKTSIPHIVPVMQLLERDWTTLTATDWSTPASKDTLEGLPRGESWEESSTGFGLDALLNHLQNAHAFCQQTNLYRINANAKLTKFLPDQGLLDACRPEFHMRMLWGSKGATAAVAERYQKFQKILGVMAEKIEPIGPGV